MSTQAHGQDVTPDGRSVAITNDGYDNKGPSGDVSAGPNSVDNQIEVLPPSPNDDRIRASVYRRIYTQPALRKYTGSPVGFGRFPSVARMAGGITQDPPVGFHAIHIIVNNGKVILLGVVNNEADANIAGMEANMAPGAFSVDNDLMVAGRPAAKAK